MAADRSEPKLPVTTLVALLAVVAGGIWITHSPLQTSRPIGAQLEKRETPILHRVPARLWQDPIAAAEEQHRKETSEVRLLVAPDHRHEIDRLAVEVADRLSEPAGQGRPVTLLLVMTAGSLYEEGGELRVRDRYAVVSALGVACFVPEDAEHIGYVAWTPAASRPSPTPPAGPALLLAYEWYRTRRLSRCDAPGAEEPASAPAQSVLVLWLKDEAIADHLPGGALSALHTFLSDLAEALATACRAPTMDGCRSPSSSLRFTLIGPRSSTTLRAMLADALGPMRGTRWPTPDGRLPLYSPWATAMPGLLARSLTDRTGPQPPPDDEWTAERLAAALGEAGVTLAHTTPSDDRLATALVDELERRGVTPGDPTQLIALVSEWDTFYGRTLPLEFAAAACAKASALARARAEPPIAGCATPTEALGRLIEHRAEYPIPWIHRYSYLRGLDGELPRDNDGKPAPRRKPAQERDRREQDEDRRTDFSALERPEGQAQLDYVRRLATRMETFAADLRAEGKEFRAIGVLGSDAYDKLLILQALRPRFPRALFFTTDLDERLTHPREYAWTRNLIVVSHFGLRLHDDLQQDVPPFRDSYQPSAFLAVLRALGHVWPDGATASPLHAALSARTFDGAPAPRVFEVGRLGPVDLSLDDPAAAPTGLHAPRPPLVNVGVPIALGPLRFHLGLLLTAGSLLLAAAVAALLTVGPCQAAVRRGFHAVTAGPGRLRALAAGTLAVSAILTCVLLLRRWLLSDGPAGEPFSLLDGVSTWPTIALRALAAGLSLGLLVRAVALLRRSERDLTQAYRLEGPAAPAPRGAWLRWMCAPRPAGPVDAAALWAEYRAAGALRHRVRRVLLLALPFFAIAALLFRSLGAGVSPCRGAVNCTTDTLVLVAGVLALTALMLFVFDATRLCKSFIDKLAAGLTLWPADLLDARAREWNTAPVDLADRLDIEFIAAHTAVVNRLIYYPFVALFLTVVARHRVFDNWDLPLALILVWGLLSATAVASALLLRRAAEQARAAALARLRRRLFALAGAGESDRPPAEQVRLLIEEVAATREGAFASILNQPAVTATLLGLAAVLQQFVL